MTTGRYAAPRARSGRPGGVPRRAVSPRRAEAGAPAFRPGWRRPSGWMLLAGLRLAVNVLRLVVR